MTFGGGKRREEASSDEKELIERMRPLEDLRASFLSFNYKNVSVDLCQAPAKGGLTSLAANTVSSGSLKTIDLSPTLNLRFLNDAGVGDAARGYCRASRSFTARGGRKIKGGKEVVVVVVVVTTVVRVVGAKENCPRASLDGPCSRPSLSCSSISRRRGWTR